MVITKICGCTTWSKDGDVNPIDFSKVQDVSETGVERRLLTSGYSEQSTYRIKRKNDRINRWGRSAGRADTESLLEFI